MEKRWDIVSPLSDGIVYINVRSRKASKRITKEKIRKIRR